jgi:hypothetical protein
MRIETVRLWVEIGASAVTILGFPILLVSYNFRKRNEEKEQQLTRLANQAFHDEKTYSDLHDHYDNYLTLSMAHPELDVFYLGLENPPPLTELQEIQATALFNIFLSVIESAYIHFQDTSEHTTANQLDGWRDLALRMLSRPRTRTLYENEKWQYDRSFIEKLDLDLKERLRFVNPTP